MAPDNRNFDLVVRQQPKQARMCGVGGKADRRPIDPPPIVQLRVITPGDTTAGLPPITNDKESSEFLQNPYYFMFASLAAPDSDEELHLLKDGKTRYTTGSVVSSLYHLKDHENGGKDAGFFVFPDLSVRTEGSYRLKLSLFEVVGAQVHHCKSIFSMPFYVYTAKKFPGMEESTQLSCSLADQGIKIRIRKDIRVRKRPVQVQEILPILEDDSQHPQLDSDPASPSGHQSLPPPPPPAHSRSDSLPSGTKRARDTTSSAPSVVSPDISKAQPTPSAKPPSAPSGRDSKRARVDTGSTPAPSTTDTPVQANSSIPPPLAPQTPSQYPAQSPVPPPAQHAYQPPPPADYPPGSSSTAPQYATQPSYQSAPATAYHPYPEYRHHPPQYSSQSHYYPPQPNYHPHHQPPPPPPPVHHTHPSHLGHHQPPPPPPVPSGPGPGAIPASTQSQPQQITQAPPPPNTYGHHQPPAATWGSHHPPQQQYSYGAQPPRYDYEPQAQPAQPAQPAPQPAYGQQAIVSNSQAPPAYGAPAAGYPQGNAAYGGTPPSPAYPQNPNQSARERHHSTSGPAIDRQSSASSYERPLTSGSAGGRPPPPQQQPSYSSWQQQPVMPGANPQVPPPSAPGGAVMQQDSYVRRGGSPQSVQPSNAPPYGQQAQQQYAGYAPAAQPQQGYAATGAASTNAPSSSSTGYSYPPPPGNAHPHYQGHYGTQSGYPPPSHPGQQAYPQQPQAPQNQRYEANYNNTQPQVDDRRAGSSTSSAPDKIHLPPLRADSQTGYYPPPSGAYAGASGQSGYSPPKQAQQTQYYRDPYGQQVGGYGYGGYHGQSGHPSSSARGGAPQRESPAAAGGNGKKNPLSIDSIIREDG
ncbi:hypothetical protein FRB99_002997 [Tulasnella sp. 403]|nr:hypothetical protein FRB99_002997 [Tulasnella sp. 403]